MAECEWFRHVIWSAAIAENFFAKLARARKKDQYLRIQALYLVEKYPEVALDLLDRFFSLAEPFDEAQARSTQARAFAALGRDEDAVGSYRLALEAERVMPFIRTDAWLDFAVMVATRKLNNLYQEAQDLLVSPDRRCLFPLQRFKRLAASALIEFEVGDRATARRLAEEALTLATVRHSGIERHPGVGLVGEQEEDLRRKLVALAAQKYSLLGGIQE